MVLYFVLRVIPEVLEIVPGKPVPLEISGRLNAGTEVSARSLYAEYRCIDCQGVPPLLRLILRAVVVPRLTVRIDNVQIDGDNVAQGSQPSTIVEGVADYRTLEGEPLRELALTSDTLVFSQTSVSAAQVDGMVTRRMQFRAVRFIGSPDERKAHDVAEVRVSEEGGATYRQTVHWKSPSLISAKPSCVFLRASSPSLRSRRVELDAARPFHASVSESISNGIQVRVEPDESDKQVQVTVALTDDRRRTSIEKGKILIETDIPECPRVVIPVYLLPDLEIGVEGEGGK